MKKALKIFAIVLLALIVLIVSVPFLFKGKLFEIVQEQINNNVNATVKFDDFNVSIFHSFPSLTVTLDELSVVGVDTFEGDTLAYLKQFYVDLDIMSVINGEQIEVEAIVLNNPVIRGRVLKDSSASWDIAMPSEEVAVEDTLAEDATDTSATQFKLGLERFEIIDADIIYDDVPGNTYAHINDFDFLLTGDFTQDFTSLDITMAIAELTAKSGGVGYLKQAEFEFIAGIDADLANAKYVFKENNLRLNNLELGFDGSVDMPESGDINMDLTFGAKKTTFKNILSLVPAVYLTDFASVKTDGKLALDGSAKGTFNGDKEQYPAFDLKLVVENAMFKYPDLPGSVDNVNINLAVTNPDGILDNTVVDLSTFHVEFSGNPFDVNLLVRTPMSDPLLKCGFNGTIDLGKLKDVIPLEGTELTGVITSDISLEGNLSTLEKEQYEEFKALGNLNIANLDYKSEDLPQGATIKSTHIEFAPKYVTLHEFDSKVGKSDFKLDGKLENFIPYALADGTLKGTLNLTSNVIDVNEFMGEEETAETEVVAEEETVAEDTVQEVGDPVEVPKNIDFVLTTNIVKILYDKMDITDVAGKVIVRGGKAQLENLDMYLLDGSMKLNGYYSTEDLAKPTIDFGMDIKDFDISTTYNSVSTMQELVPYAEKADGKFSMALAINSLVDNAMSPILNTLDGEGSIATKQITAEGGKLANQIADKLKDDKYRKYEFKNVNADFTIEDGNITLKPFKTEFNGNKATVEGVSNLDQTIDYTIATEVPRSNLGGAANSVIEGLNALAADNGVNAGIGDIILVDMLIDGTMDDPKVKFKLGTASSDGSSSSLSGMAKDELMRQKAELEAKAKAEATKLKAEAEAKVAKAKAEAAAKAKAAKEKAEAEAKAKAAKIKAEADAKAAAAKKKAEEEAKSKAKSYSDQAKQKLKW